MKRPVMVGGDLTEIGPAGHQVVGARAQPSRHDQPADHPPVFERHAALGRQRQLRPPGCTGPGEEHAGDRGDRVAGEHPGRDQVGAVGIDELLNAGIAGR